MAQNFTFEFLFDERKADQQIEGLAKRFVAAFNRKDPFEGTKADLVQLMAFFKQRLGELDQLYKKASDDITKVGGNPEDNPGLKKIQAQIDAVKELEREISRLSKETRSSAAVDITGAFQQGRSFTGTKSEFEKRIADTEAQLKELQAQIKDTYAQLEGKGVSTKDNPILERLKQYAQATKAELDGVKLAYKELKAMPDKVQATDLAKFFTEGYSFSGNKAQLRKAINETRTEMRLLQKTYTDTMTAMQAAGRDTDGSPELEKMSTQIDQLKAKYEGLMAKFQEGRQKNENIFMGISQGARGLMGIFTAAQGAASLFGAEEEKLQKIQTKLQSSMSILMGLQAAGNLLNSQSQFRLQVLNNLLAKWHAWNLKVAQSEGIKKTAMMASAAGVAGLIVLLTTLIIKMSKYADEVKRATDLQKAFKNEYANNASSMMQTLAKLLAGWQALNGDVEKQEKFFFQYKSDFQSLDKSINSVASAENAMNAGTQTVIDNLKKKATAAAYLAQVYDILGKIAKNEATMELPKPDSSKANWADYVLYGITGGWMGGTTFDEYWEATFANRDKRLKEENKKELARLKEITESEEYKKAMAGLLDENDDSYEKALAAKLDSVRKGRLAIMQLEEDMANRLREQQSSIEQNEFKRELEALNQNYEKRKQEIEREKKDYIEKLREQAKLEYAYGNPNADESKIAAFGRNWKPTSEQEQKIKEYFDELMRIAGVAYDRSVENLYTKMQESKWEYWEKYGTVGNREKAIIERYNAKLKEATDKKDYWGASAISAEKEEKLWELLNASRLEYLEQYGDSLEKELAITEKYDHLIEKEVDEHRKKILENQKRAEIDNIRRNNSNNIIFWDEKQLSRNTLKKALAEAEKELERLRREGSSTNEEINVMLQRVQAIRGELENTNFMTNGGAQNVINVLLKLKDANDMLAASREKMLRAGTQGSYAEFERYLKEVKENKELVEKQKEALRSALIGTGVSAFTSTLQQAAEAMRQIAELSGDTKFKEFAGQFSSLVQNFAAAGEGAATGGWIGAIVGGATDLINQTVQALSEAPVLEELAKRNAEDWARALKNVNVEMDKAAYSSPFGERTIEKGREAMRSSLEAMDRYKEELAELNKKYSQQEIDQFTQRSIGGTIFGFGSGGLIESMMGAGTGLGFLVPLLGLKKDKISNEFKAYEEAIAKGYDGLQKMLVKTKDRSRWANLFGFQDEYKSLGDLYPELFKDGELVIEQAKLLLETNNQLDETQKKEIENIINLKEAYDEAVAAIDEVISSTFSSLASDLTDIIWDSVMNGTDAWAEFKKVGSSAITALGKQLLQELLISTYLDNFRERMRDAYKLGDATQAQTEIRNITAEIFGGLTGVFDSLAGVAQDWKDWAEKEGFDLKEANGRSTASKAISGVSQESFDDALGRFTAIQSHTYEINETTKALREQQANLLAVTSAILSEVIGIHQDTERMQQSLDMMQGDMTIVRSNVTTMADKGVRMLN